jgi:hypothetical protein
VSKLKFYYSDGSELLKNDTVLINDKQTAQVENILIPGTEEAKNYSCEEGGFILVFENGDVQVWPDTDEDISLVRRNC